MDMDETQEWYRRNASREQLLEEVDNQHRLYLKAKEDVAYYRDAIAEIWRIAYRHEVKVGIGDRPSSPDQVEELIGAMNAIVQKASETLHQRNRKFE